MAGSPLTSFIGRRGAEGRFFEHVFFFGQDKELHELRYDGIWQDIDLTGKAGVRRPAGRSPLTGFWDTPVDPGSGSPSFEHVFYVDMDGNVCGLLQDGSGWRSISIPSQPPGAQWAAGSSLTSFFGGPSRRENVMYTGRDGHVHALWFDGRTWHANDLTELSGPAPPPLTVPVMSPLTSLWDPTSSNGDGGTQHVFYIGNDGHVRELGFDGTNWHSSDLNAAAQGSVRPAMSRTMVSPLTSFFGGTLRRENVLYLGKDEHVHELFSDGHAWRSGDLTQAAPDADAPGVMPTTPLTSYSWPEEGTEHVFFIGANGDLWELWFDGSWHSNNLTRAASHADVPALMPMTPLTSYSWPEEGTEHVFCIGGGGDLWEFWFDGSWHANNLTQAT